MTTAYIAFGSNLGDRNENIQAALRLLGAHPGIKIIKISSIIETMPQGGPPQPEFLNGVTKLETSLSARKLLEVLQKIETDLGRRRQIPNGPRTIDLDIILYGDKVINEPDLIIPHPRWRDRDFVVRPLREIM
jgi:2-amino-4-hydroxy-6-hydroxymethyldihydropteridine diphosphokinase